jgi:hypothetical protein
MTDKPAPTGPKPTPTPPVVDAPGPENADDTIHIDREGNLIRKDDETPA